MVRKTFDASNMTWSWLMGTGCGACTVAIFVMGTWWLSMLALLFMSIVTAALIWALREQEASGG